MRDAIWSGENQAKFDALPKWAQFVSVNPNTTRYGLILSPFLVLTVMGLSPLGFLLSGALVVFGLKKVPADPEPFVAVLQVLEIRLPVLFSEGYVLTVPWLMELVLVKVTQIDLDWTFTGVPARLKSIAEDHGDGALARTARALNSPDVPDPETGGSVTKQVQVILRPDKDNPWSIIDLLNRGGVTKAIDFLKGFVGEDVRQAGRSLTWTEMVYATDILSAKLIADVTGHRNIEDDGTSVLDNPTEQGLRKFLEHVKRNGISDIKGSGFIIRALNVVQVIPEGELANASDKIAVEYVKKLQLKVNAEAIREAVDILQGGEDGDGTLSDAAATAALQAEDGTVKKSFQEFKVADVKEIAEALRILVGK